MPTLYIFEDGTCRGESFCNKTVINTNTAIELFEAGMLIKDEDDRDEWVEDRLYSDHTFDEAVALRALIFGSDCCNDEEGEQDTRLKNLKDGVAFGVGNEESVIGFADSKKEARAAAATLGIDEW